MIQALTAPQLQELTALLEARRQALQAQVAQSRANLAPAENTGGSVSQDERGRLAHQTREVDAAPTALDEMADGGYGDCEECGRPSPFERLKAEPMTRHGVQCKSEWEQAQPA
ncbi:MAG: hypothetical protein QM772_08200 [Ottowia sp.]|uniref:TraR/DksA family transcriptional regulator n=1 Tax=Ottowia sp. TaxID=1898956 RepID=UPI0039E36682